MDSQVTQDNTSALKGMGFALAAFAVFSLHDVIVKWLTQYSVFQIIFFSILFGYVPFSLARLLDSRAISLRPVHPWLILLRSLLMVNALCCAFIGFSMLPMVQVYVLLFMTPLFISLLAIPFLGEKIRWFRWITILLGLVGIIIVLRPSTDSLQLGHLFGLLSALSGAGASIIARKIGHIENTSTLLLAPMLLNIIVSGSFLYFVYEPMPLSDLALMFLIGVLALLGHLLILSGYRHAPAALVAPMQYSQLIWAILYGVIFFGDSVDIYIIIGSVITILSGLLLIWRETQVSRIQPILRTRNMRMVSGAPIISSESDQSEINPPAKQD